MDEKVKPYDLADAIDMAINEKLWDGASTKTKPFKDEFSCIAIYRALRFNVTAKHKASAFIQKLGCTPGGLNEFKEIDVGEKRQYARALWLTWASMIAREEGL